MKVTLRGALKGYFGTQEFRRTLKTAGRGAANEVELKLPGGAKGKLNTE